MNQATSFPHYTVTAALLGLLLAGSLQAAESQRELQITVENTVFAQPSPQGQPNRSTVLSAEAKQEWEWNDGYDEVTINPVVRFHSADSRQNRFDFRSLSWTHQADDWAIRSGIRTVTWQVAESLHLVDIVNQIDAAADVDGEDKLGELMVNAMHLFDWGNAEILIMPGFRERVLPGEEGRLRPAIPYETESADYESGAENLRTDIAARVTWIPGDMEIAISHFSGTSRAPQFRVVDAFPDPREAKLRPIYPVIDQTGLEFSWAAGNWLWKAEAISNQGYERYRYAAAVAGFEFTWSGLGDTGYDIGALAEYLWDERDKAPLQRDVFAGVRLSLNDIAGTQLLLGGATDLHTEEYFVSAEFSRRLGSRWFMEIEARAFGGGSRNRPTDLQLLHKDDHINLKLTRYY